MSFSLDLDYFFSPHDSKHIFPCKIFSITRRVCKGKVFLLDALHYLPFSVYGHIWRFIFFYSAARHFINSAILSPGRLASVCVCVCVFISPSPYPEVEKEAGWEMELWRICNLSPFGNFNFCRAVL